MLPTAEHITDYGVLTGRVAQFCTEGDVVCSMPADSALARTVAKAVTGINATGGDPIKTLQTLGDSLAITPAQAVTGAINEDVTGTSLDSVDYQPSMSISQRLENAAADPIDSTRAAHLAGHPSQDGNNPTSANPTSSSSPSSQPRASQPRASQPGASQPRSTSTSKPSPQVPSRDSSDSLAGLGNSVGEAAGAAAGAVVGGLGGDARLVATAQDSMAALSKLGIIGVNAAITIARKTITPDTIAQVAAVGLANPGAGLALLGSKVADSAVQVLAPVGMKAAGEAFTLAKNEVADNKGLITMATDVTYWRHWSNHTSYGSTPVTATGTSAVDYTANWIIGLLAGAGDHRSDRSFPAASSTTATSRESSTVSQTRSSKASSSESELSVDTTAEPIADPAEDTGGDLQ